jgi:polar amino acid transport system substrate-binding protein
VRVRVARACAVLIVACAAGGCASISDTAQQRSLAALGTEVPRTTSSAPGRCPDVRFTSLAPTPLPRPGAMRRGTLMQQIHDRGHLLVGVDQNSLGLGYFNAAAGGRHEGLDIALVWEIVKAIFARPTQDNIRYIAIATSQREQVVRDGDVDLVASAFSITCDRQKRLRFSSVYYRAQQRLLVLEGADVQDMSDLAGARVCATSGSTSLERLGDFPEIVPHPVALRPDCLVALQEGEVGAVTSDDAILYGFARQDPQTRIVGPCLAIERYGLAMRKDADHRGFVRFVNAVLARLERTGDLDRIRRASLRGLEQPTKFQIDRCEGR